MFLCSLFLLAFVGPYTEQSLSFKAPHFNGPFQHPDLCVQFLGKMGLLLSLGIEIMGDFNFIFSFSKLYKITVLIL